MKEYHKINSIYKRDMSQKTAPFIVGDYAESVFEYLKDTEWIWTEKVDGTNIRVMLNNNEIVFGGKTDNAQIPAHLVKKLQDYFQTVERKELLHEVFHGDWQDICLYGEGFGHKIQGKIGTDYLMGDVDFVLFDVRIGDFWLERKNVEDIANKLGLKVVPIVGTGTLDQAIELVKKGFKSSFGTAQAEGLVLRPKVELKTRGGDRIITKIKYVDFHKP